MWLLRAGVSPTEARRVANGASKELSKIGTTPAHDDGGGKEQRRREGRRREDPIVVDGQTQETQEAPGLRQRLYYFARPCPAFFNNVVISVIYTAPNI